MGGSREPTEQSCERILRRPSVARGPLCARAANRRRRSRADWWQQRAGTHGVALTREGYAVRVSPRSLRVESKRLIQLGCLRLSRSAAAKSAEKSAQKVAQEPAQSEVQRDRAQFHSYAENVERDAAEIEVEDLTLLGGLLRRDRRTGRWSRRACHAHVLYGKTHRSIGDGAGDAKRVREGSVDRSDGDKRARAPVDAAYVQRSGECSRAVPVVERSAHRDRGDR